MKLLCKLHGRWPPPASSSRNFTGLSEHLQRHGRLCICGLAWLWTIKSGIYRCAIQNLRRKILIHLAWLIHTRNEYFIQRKYTFLKNKIVIQKCSLFMWLSLNGIFWVSCVEKFFFLKSPAIFALSFGGIANGKVCLLPTSSSK